MQYPHTENYKGLLRKNNGKKINGEIRSLQINLQIYSTIPLKIPTHVFVEADKLILKFSLVFKRARITSMVQKKNKEDLNYLPSSFYINLQSSNKHVLVSGQTNRSMEQIENPEIDPHTYTQLIFHKDAKAIQWKKESPFNKRC